MDDLKEKRCLPCEAGVKPLSDSEAREFLQQLKQWELAGTKIHKTFKFKNFYHTMAFVNAIAYIANQENHHPDLSVSYNQCIVEFTTHAIEGLSKNDFICAAKIDALQTDVKI
jgi:4a-hydroxytetrahydrobiopterin dehydratase